MTAGNSNDSHRSKDMARRRLAATTSTIALLAAAFAPSVAHAQQASCGPGGGPYTSGSPVFNNCVVDATTPDTFSGTVAAVFRNGAVLNANVASAINGGIVQLPTFDAVVNANVANAISGGTLNINGTVNGLDSGAINGGWLRLGGDGVINIRAVNATTENTDLEFGSQAVTAGGLLNLNGYNTIVGRITNYIPSGQIVNGGAADAVLTVDGSVLGDSSFGGVIADGAGGGTLALVQHGRTTLTLSGSNTYTGGTRIDVGVLKLEGNGTLGAPTGALDIASGGTLIFNTAALTVGSLSGAGSITRSDFNPGVLTVDQAINTTFSGAITDYFDEINGVTTMTGLTKSGTGTLTLSGTSTHTGTTNVTGGTLLVDGTFGHVMWGPIQLGTSQVAVASGGTLGGAGSIAGDVSVADGGRLLGRAGQTLSMGSLALSSGSLIDVSLGAPSGTRLFNVANNLTLNGTLNVADAGGFGNGLYRLFDYGGTLSGSGLAIGTTPAGYAANDLTVQTAVANQVNLLVGAVASGSYGFWNGGQTTPNNTVNGGAGTWTATGTNWTYANGSASGVYDPAAMLIFQSTPGTVSVDAGGGALDVKGGMQFFVSDYKVAGDALNLSAPATPIRVGDGTAAGAGMTATIASVITGSGGIDKTDLGTLVLSGINTYTGGTTISAGTLKLDDGTLGAPSGALAIASGGTLDIFGSNQTVGALSGAGSITSSMSGGQQSSLTVNQASNTSYDGAITDGYSTGSGTGTLWLLKNGAGTLALTGTSTFAFTSVDGGTLAIANGGKIVNVTSFVGDAYGSNGTILVTGNGSLWSTDYLYLGYRGAGTLTIADGGKVIAASISMVRSPTASATVNLNGTAGARGVLETNGIQKGLDGATVNFDGGILRATAFNADLLSHFAAGDVTIKAGGAFIDSNGGSVMISSPLGGVGALTKQGAGSLTLTGANSYAGGTVIESGTLQVIGSGTLGAPTGALSIAGGATLDLGGTSQTVGALLGAGTITSTNIAPSLLVVNQAIDAIFSGVIADGFDPIAGGAATVGLTKRGTGTLLLAGNNTYTGDTTINDGTLSVNGSIASSSLLTVNSGGTLSGNGTVGNTIINAGGTLAPGNSIGLLTVQGDLTFMAGSTYRVEVSPSAADRVNVSGTATLNGATLSAIYEPGSYVNKRYTLLNATGGVNGRFSGPVNTNLPTNFSSALDYDVKNVYLDLSLNYMPASPPAFGNGLTANQTRVASALVNSFNTAGGIPLVFGVLGPSGLTQASGESATGVQQSTFTIMDRFLNLMNDPTASGRATAMLPMSYAPLPRGTQPIMVALQPRWSVWAAGYGGTQMTRGSAVVGTNTYNGGIYGMAAGADYHVSPDTVIGFALGGGGTSYHLASGLGSGSSNVFQAGLYGRQNFDALYVAGSLAYGWQDVTTDRRVMFDQLRARFSAHSFSGRIESGYRIGSPFGGLTPYAAGQFTNIALPSYSEQAITGPGLFALNYASKNVTAWRSELGLRGDTAIDVGAATLWLRGRLAWAHNFNPDRSVSASFLNLPASSFVVNGAAQARNAALISAGAEMKWPSGWSIAANFEGEFSGRGNSYAGKGAVRYQW